MASRHGPVGYQTRSFGWSGQAAFPRSVQRVVSKPKRAFQTGSRNPHLGIGPGPRHRRARGAGRCGQACRPSGSGGERVRKAISRPPSGSHPADADEPHPSFGTDATGKFRRVHRMRQRHRSEKAGSYSLGAVLRQVSGSERKGLSLALAVKIQPKSEISRGDFSELCPRP